MKNFHKHIQNTKTIGLKNRIADIGKNRYLPSFSKEWKNIIYSYNKNTIKNIPNHFININKIIQNYFNLYFVQKNFVPLSKYILLRKRRSLLRKIYISNAEIKHTNNKAIITLFTLNREKNYLHKKYVKMNKKIYSNLIQRYLFLYKNNITHIYNILNKHSFTYQISKKQFIHKKLVYLNTFLTLKNLYLKKVWSIIINNYANIHLKVLRKNELNYSLNQWKFNKLVLLNKLSNLLAKILGKKIEYNIINLKSIGFNTDIFTQALAIKFQKRKSFNYKRNILTILNKIKTPFIDTTVINKDQNLLNKYKDSKLLSYINKKNNIDKLLNLFNNSHNTNIHKEIFESIQYKNISGIRIEVKGRLTKRYRADRSLSYKKYKGGLKNSSLESMNIPLLRGNINPHTSHSIINAKRRVGSFAIKGWIAGK